MKKIFAKAPLVLIISSLISSAVFAEEIATPEEVIVFGHGETRQVSEIGQEEIAQAAPGTSPLKILSKLPGVNFNSADSLGSYEWGGRISIRGFNQNQLGFTLDGVPLGDMSYRNYNGLHISRAISTENIGRVAVAQGTGSLGTASTSNLGGAIEFYTLNPSDEQSFRIDQTLGQNNLRRTFARFDSGEFGYGTKIFLSVTDQKTDKWKGDGEQTLKQFNSKLTHDFESSKLSIFANYSDRSDADYMDLSKSSVARLGYNWDYFALNWDLAKQVAVSVPVGNITSQDDAYYNGSGLRTDKLVGATLDNQFTDDFSLKTTIYHHDQEGTGTWWTPYRASPGGFPISLRTLEFDIDRSGILSALNYSVANHKINAGVWYENNDFGHAMRFYAQDNGPSSAYERPSNPFFTRWNYAFNTETLQFHLQDTIQVSDRVSVNLGFKSPKTETKISTLADTAAGAELNGSLTAKKSVLPSFGISFKADDSNEYFANISQNIRAYRGVVKGGTSPFDTTQAGFDAVKNNINPEQSTSTEAGWRLHTDDLDVTAAIYHIDFKDRLLALQQGSAIAGNASVLANVGKVEANGFELAVNWSFADNFSWSNSFSYNNAEYKNDFTSNGVVYHTNGKQVVDSPKTIINSELGYNNGSLSAHLGANYLAKRYYTYTNDQSVDGYTLVDIGAGYEWNTSGFAKKVSLQAGVNNLLDKEYFAFGDNPNEAVDPTGDAYNLLAGAPRTAFVKVSATF
jgi:iron complex outermembrane receptor protein